MTLRQRYPDLDFRRAWRGGPLLAPRASSTPLGLVARELPDEELNFTPREVARIDRALATLTDPAPQNHPWSPKAPRPCACGCGGLIVPPYWRQQRFLRGHNQRRRDGGE